MTSCFHSGSAHRLGLGIERPARARGRVERVGEPGGEAFGARPGDHRAIVGAEPERRRDEALVEARGERSEEHTSELQSLMRISYAVFCLKKKKLNNNRN